MSVLISMMAVMLMRWVLSRYILANRVHNSTMAQTRAEGSANDGVIRLHAGPSLPSCNDAVGPIVRNVSVADPQGIKTITVRIDE
jgi:hypothetical protein